MLKLEKVSLKHGKTYVLENLSHEFPTGKVTMIIGASGVGKTSLLNICAGLLKPSAGKIINDSERISYIFQEPRLFEWMNTLENVSTVNGDEAHAKEILLHLGLSDSLKKHPSELSGGMRQRVSIARALVYNPDIAFLDEPFSGLDEDLKENVAKLIFKELKGKTVIFVSHDSEDAKYADIVLKLSGAPDSRLDEVKNNS